MGAKGWLHNDAFIRHWGNLTYSVTVASFSINCTTQYASWKDRTQLVKAHEHKHTQKKKNPMVLEAVKETRGFSNSLNGITSYKKKRLEGHNFHGDTCAKSVFTSTLLHRLLSFPARAPCLGSPAWSHPECVLEGPSLRWSPSPHKCNSCVKKGIQHKNKKPSAKLNTQINLLWQQPKRFAFARTRLPAAAPLHPGQLLWQASAVATEAVCNACLLGKGWGHTQSQSPRSNVRRSVDSCLSCLLSWFHIYLGKWPLHFFEKENVPLIRLG